MDPVGILMAVAGVVILAAGWRLTRGEALTLGQGVFWVLIGLAFVVLGLISRWLVSQLGAWGVQQAEGVPPALGLLLLVAILLGQAGALGQVTRRVRALAQEMALLKQSCDRASPGAGPSRSDEQSGGPGSGS
jgi:hypothetical protein